MTAASKQSEDCAKLIYMSGPELYTYVFAKKEPEVYALITLFFENPNTLFSRQNAIIDQEDGKARGILVAYPAEDMKKMSLSMLKLLNQMFRQYSLRDFIKMLFRMKLNRHFPGTGKDEYFIANIAVFEDFRGQGIATNMLKRAEAAALEKGINKLSLYVETDNPRAKRVYEHFGFKETKKTLLPKSYHKHHLYGFYKMVKEIKSDK